MDDVLDSARNEPVKPAEEDKVIKLAQHLRKMLYGEAVATQYRNRIDKGVLKGMKRQTSDR